MSRKRKSKIEKIQLCVTALGALLLLNNSDTFAMGSRRTEPLPDSSMAGNRHIINDSLVSNLRCANLRKETVLSSLQQNAFTIARQIPIHNWSTGQGLAECWSLSHAQRLIFYMGRFGQAVDHSQPSFNSYLETVANHFSGENDETPSVFPIDEIHDLIASLRAGFTDSKGNSRTFQKDIQDYQQWRFYHFDNLNKITSSHERSQEQNIQTFNDIKMDLQLGRLPLVIIRMSRASQHAVLIKRITGSSGGLTHFSIYDSRLQNGERQISYDERTNEFYAPDVLESFGKEPNAPVGLFLVDEDDMDTIQTALLQYYQNQCIALQRR